MTINLDKLITVEQKQAQFMASKQAEFTAAIQKRLDDFAKTRNYDSALSAASYATSSNPTFSAEGQYIVEVRDLTWATGYAILDDVLNGIRPIPGGIEDFEDELPSLEWPE
ncbi:hypothetical protein [Methylophaga sp.]|uniref:hypothetical protein n=1 Tax=Methylophaga sp. TaxID=2024840 RepID=UPI003A904B47